MGPVVGVIAQILVALSLAGIGIAQVRGKGIDQLSADVTAVCMLSPLNCTLS